MPAAILERNDRSFTVQVTIPYVETMLEFEEAIQSCVNELGQAATQEALGRFDTDGAPLEFGGTRFFSKGAEPKEYQTPYGPVTLDRLPNVNYFLTSVTIIL